MYLIGVVEVGTCSASTELASWNFHPESSQNLYDAGSESADSAESGSSCSEAPPRADSVGPLRDTSGDANATVTIDAGGNEFNILHCSREFAGFWGSDPCGQSLLQCVSNSQKFFEAVQENVNAIMTEADSDES